MIEEKPRTEGVETRNIERAYDKYSRVAERLRRKLLRRIERESKRLNVIINVVELLKLYIYIYIFGEWNEAMYCRDVI